MSELEKFASVFQNKIVRYTFTTQEQINGQVMEEEDIGSSYSFAFVNGVYKVGNSVYVALKCICLENEEEDVEGNIRIYFSNSGRVEYYNIENLRLSVFERDQNFEEIDPTGFEYID